jgi:hypothetical protein
MVRTEFVFQWFKLEAWSSPYIVAGRHKLGAKDTQGVFGLCLATF